MPLSTESPLTFSSLGSIDVALQSTGHAVLENVWNTEYLASLRRDAAARFERDDARFVNGFDGYPDSMVDCYLASFVGLENLFETDATVALNVALD
jgi:hypothetical protein